MRTDIVIDMIEKDRGFTLDTCFLIQAYKNPKFSSFFIRKGFHSAKNFVNEVEYNGFDKTKILLKIKELFGKVIVKDVTNEERIFGQQLEKTCSVLHSGDSAILAFAKRTSTTLVTLDKNLAKSCKFFNVDCILAQLIQKYGGTSSGF